MRWLAPAILAVALAGPASAAPWAGREQPGAQVPGETVAPPGETPPARAAGEAGDAEEEERSITPIFLSNSSDPYVMLDEAKQSIGDGKLRRASEMLAMIQPGAADDYAAEELLFQRLLLAGAFLNAAGAVLHDAAAAGYGQSKYADWLRGEVARYAQDYAALAGQYLAATSEGLACDFVRFRLPRVTAEHLQDAVLYADPQVLKAAVETWDEERTGLGKGLIGTQARVALVLGAATYYDLPQSSATIEGLAVRLRNGVPLEQRIVLDWLAQTAADQAGAGGPALRQVQMQADTRLQPLLTQPDTPLKHRYDKRNGLAAEPPDQPAGKRGNSKSNNKR